MQTFAGLLGIDIKQMTTAELAELERVTAGICLRQHLDVCRRLHPDWNCNQVLAYMEEQGILLPCSTGYLVRMRPSRSSPS